MLCKKEFPHEISFFFTKMLDFFIFFIHIEIEILDSMGKERLYIYE